MRLLLLVSTSALIAAAGGCGDGAELAVDLQASEDAPFRIAWSELSADLRDVVFVDAARGWAVGDSGTILATNDGGRRWLPQQSGTETWLSRVDFVDEMLGWAAGRGRARDAILRTRDGGASWTRLAAPGSGGLSDLELVDAQVGFVSVGGGLFRTTDAGDSWTEIDTPAPVDEIEFADAETGLAVVDDGRVAATRDGGAHWTLHATGVSLPVQALELVDTRHGWLAVWNRILRSEDGGATWRPSDTELNGVGALFFLDERRGWVAGRDAGLWRTTDGGRTFTVWTWDAAPTTYFDIGGLWFVDALRGWAVGDHGIVLSTRDGGASWERANPLPTPSDLGLAEALRARAPREEVGVTLRTVDNDFDVEQVLVANATTSFAIGTRIPGAEDDPTGVILSTADAGDSWQTFHLQDHPRAILYAPDGLAAVYTEPYFDGAPGLWLGRVTQRGPSLERFAAREVPGGLALRWQTRSRIEPVEVVAVEFSPGTARHFGPIELGSLESARDGAFTLRFDPAEYGVRPGSALRFRVTLKDAAGLRFTQAVPGAIAYRPWWDRQSNAVRGGILFLAVVAGLYASGAVLLLVSPLGLLWLYERVPLRRLADLIPVAPVRTLVEISVETLGGGFLARHPRVRSAWCRRLAREPAALSGISPALRDEFLVHPEGRDAWIGHYVAGRCALDGLSPACRAAYLSDPAVLDAFVERRVEAAREAFEELDTVGQRPLWIGLPFWVGDPETGERVDRPDPGVFRRLVEGTRGALEIVGAGGTGKTTLAAQLGRWALGDEEATRLLPHPCLPVFVAEESDDVQRTAMGLCKEIAGPHELEADVFAGLLTHGRLLLVVDSLSERTERTVQAVREHLRECDPAHVVVTTRRPLGLGARTARRVHLESVTLQTLFYFLAEYLLRTGNAELFPGRQPVELGDRLLAAVERGGGALELTPLFITIFTDQAVDLRRAGRSLDELPSTMAEAILEHLRRTNPKDPQTPNRVGDERLLRAARVLGRLALGRELVPRSFDAVAAEQALEERDGGDRSDAVRRLRDNGILEARSRGGRVLLQFALDPVAEHLGALALLDELGGDLERWKRFVAELEALPDHPDAQRGFLLSLESCVAAYGAEFEIPEPMRRRRWAAGEA